MEEPSAAAPEPGVSRVVVFDSRRGAEAESAEIDWVERGA